MLSSSLQIPVGCKKRGIFFKIPCVIPRSETEWVELLENDWAILTGNDKKNIVDKILAGYDNSKAREWKTFYSDGNAAVRIANVLANLQVNNNG